jgi:hypothetical protein
MKTALLVVSGFLLIAANSYCTETLFGPGTIKIGTNETILITGMGSARGEVGPKLSLDGVDVTPDLDFYVFANLISAVSGPHNLVATNESLSDFFITFQRLTNSTITTIVTLPNATNVINVPEGKTIQFFSPLGDFYSIPAMVQPQESTEWVTLRFLWNSGLPYPCLAGVAKIRFSTTTVANLYSYYFTDDVVQFPPRGLLSLPATILQVHIEKSSDLANWTPKAVFHTEAETGAFYRLKMLK